MGNPAILEFREEGGRITAKLNSDIDIKAGLTKGVVVGTSESYEPSFVNNWTTSAQCGEAYNKAVKRGTPPEEAMRRAVESIGFTPVEKLAPQV